MHAGDDGGRARRIVDLRSRVVDACGVLSRSLPCKYCGYDLRGRRVDDRCSECGKPVHKSLKGAWARFEDDAWLRRVRDGAAYLTLGIGLYVVPVVVGALIIAALSYARGAPGRLSVLIYYPFIVAAAAVLTAIGVWRLGTPSVARFDRHVTLRRAGRRAACLATPLALALFPVVVIVGRREPWFTLSAYSCVTLLTLPPWCVTPYLRELRISLIGRQKDRMYSSRKGPFVFIGAMVIWRLLESLWDPAPRLMLGTTLVFGIWGLTAPMLWRAAALWRAMNTLVQHRRRAAA